MDAELLNGINVYAATNRHIQVLGPDETEHLRDLVAHRFGFPENRIWWWECLPKTAIALTYTGEEGLEHLSGILPDGDVLLYLFVTDDDPPPWLCVSGPPKALIEMLREQRFFEYFVVDPEMKWIVFDNHHNTLVAFGEGLRSWQTSST